MVERPREASTASTVTIALDDHTQMLVGLTPRQLRAKRVFDILLSALALLICSPFLVIIGVSVLLTSGHPILFRQTRIGLGGRPFTLLKFRSMYADAEKRLAADARLSQIYVENDFKIPANKDPRVTPIGKFLRRTSLDELPQFWNVLKGQMSIVGPRPVVPDELAQYGDLAPLYKLMRPGITGPWQIFGRYRMTFPDRGIKELSYLCDWSLWKDVVTVLKTLPAALRNGR